MKKRLMALIALLSMIILVILTACASMGTVDEKAWFDYLKKQEESYQGLGPA